MKQAVPPAQPFSATPPTPLATVPPAPASAAFSAAPFVHASATTPQQPASGGQSPVLQQQQQQKQQQQQQAGNVAGFVSQTGVEGVKSDPGNIETLRRAHASRPWHLATTLALAGALGPAPGSADEAQSLYESAIAGLAGGAGIEERRAHVLCSFANFLVGVKGDVDGGEAKYRECLESDPRHVSALYNLGLLLETSRGDTKAASRLYEKALKADPAHIPAMVNLAALRQETHRDAAGAEALYDRLISLQLPSSSSSSSSSSSAAAATTSGSKRVAWDHVPTAALINYATLLSAPERSIQDANKADSLFSKAIERGGEGCAAALTGRALLTHAKLGGASAAEKLFRKAIAADPGHLPALHGYARLLEEEFEDIEVNPPPSITSSPLSLYFTSKSSTSSPLLQIN